MDIKITQTEGSDEFHQEIIDLILKNYPNMYALLLEIREGIQEISILRDKNKGYISFVISVIDLKRDILTIEWIRIDH